MIEEVAQSLERRGCKTLSKENFSAVIKCGNAFVLKSPSNQWNVLIPATKLSILSKKLGAGLSPQYIDVGGFQRTGSWSRMFDFNITNEVRYNYTENTIKSINDPTVQQISKEMTDQQQFFNEEIREFNLQDDYRENVRKLAVQVNRITTDKLKTQNQTPVVCHSNPMVQKLWTPEGDKIYHRIQTTCVVPGVKQTIDTMLNGSLDRGTISQYDVRYITSHITADKNFMLSGIHLHQRGSPHPFLKFSLKDERVIRDSSFLTKLQNIENTFATKNDEKVGDIDLAFFTRHLF